MKLRNIIITGIFVTLAFAVLISMILLAPFSSKIVDSTQILSGYDINYSENKEFARFGCYYDMNLEKFEITIFQLESEGYKLYTAWGVGSYSYFIFRKVN